MLEALPAEEKSCAVFQLDLIDLSQLPVHKQAVLARLFAVTDDYRCSHGEKVHGSAREKVAANCCRAARLP